MSFRFTDLALLAIVMVVLLLPGASLAQTPGYPEKVVQWTVKSGESCEDIAEAMYGSASHKGLVQRYNSVACTPGAPLKNGMTLVLPAKVTTLPTAKITSVNPETRARPSGGGWSSAYAGQQLGKASSVNTRTKGRAGIQFRDRTRVYLAENTLVVIYGTAAQSQVSKSPPPAVKLDSGEVQAVLAALRGKPLAIDVQGGGRVDAASKDAVVAKKGTQTNVSVFHGSAAVSSAGKSVDVPTNYGTRFWEKKVPEKPRPLPPAPKWQTGGTRPFELSFGGSGIVAVSWAPGAKVKRYRVEVSRDAAFTDLVVRAHVPANVRAFRAEKLPLGRYHVRVRVIDTDDFLGIASTVRTIDLIGASWQRGTGQLNSEGLEVGRYAALDLTPRDDVRLGFDARPLGPLPTAIDFRRMAPKTLRFSRGGSTPTELPVRYIDPDARLSVRRSGRLVHVTLSFTKVDGIDVATVLAPRAQVRLRDGRLVEVALTKKNATTFVGTATLESDSAFVVVAQDDFGRTLASRGHGMAARAPDQPAPLEPPPFYRLGAISPILGMSPRLSTLWTSPTASNHGAIGVRIDSDRAPLALQGFAHAAGAIGSFGLDATVMTPATRDADADSSALLGLRYRAHRSEDGSFEIGPVGRIAFPLDDIGPSPRLELGVALGGAVSEWSWLVNGGARLRLDGPPEDRVFVDVMHAFIVAGGTYDALSWLRLHSAIDFHLLVPGAAQSVLGRGGLALGVEAGERFFVSLGARVTPWDDVGAGLLAGQLAIGFRER